MALVAYDYGSGTDEEDIEEEQEENTSARVILNTNIPKPQDQTETKTDHSTRINLFSSLPPTKHKEDNLKTKNTDDQIEDFIPKPPKQKEKVRITIPSLKDFDSTNEDEVPSKRSKQLSSKSSGLLSILPPVQSVPLSTKSFVPNSVQKPLIPRSVKKKTEETKISVVRKSVSVAAQKKHKSHSDFESDDDLEIPETFDEEMWQKVCGRPKPKSSNATILNAICDEPQSVQLDIAPETPQPYEGLDNQAFKELVGKSKRPMGNIKLIDINEEEILPEKDLWMTKSLTDPEMAPKAAANEDGVDPTRRRKHHITYLAQQAKANEQELQSAWSVSKHNRMMSRSKYGF